MERVIDYEDSVVSLDDITIDRSELLVMLPYDRTTG
jgi:hypothetical protein